jgi:SSS family solute:Na+ symporter
MAQNFWVAIFAWTSCFAITVVVSLTTKARPPRELEGLVYGLTMIPREVGVSWWERPGPLAAVVGAVLVLLNLYFW